MYTYNYWRKQNEWQNKMMYQHGFWVFCKVSDSVKKGFALHLWVGIDKSEIHGHCVIREVGHSKYCICVGQPMSEITDKMLQVIYLFIFLDRNIVQMLILNHLKNFGYSNYCFLHIYVLNFEILKWFYTHV